MALGGKVDDGIVSRNDTLEQPDITDVAHHKPYPVLRKTREALGTACVGELVEHRHVHARMALDDMANEVAAYEATTARDDDVRWIKRAGHGTSPIPPHTPLA